MVCFAIAYSISRRMTYRAIGDCVVHVGRELDHGLGAEVVRVRKAPRITELLASRVALGRAHRSE